jgi:hypothetical protein
MFIQRKPQLAVDDATGERVYPADRDNVIYERGTLMISYEVQFAGITDVYVNTGRRIDQTGGPLTDAERRAYAQRVVDGLKVCGAPAALV